MRVGGKTVGYYNTVAASFGFQLGAQARSVIIMFMTPEALAGFRRVEGFKVGVDGSVAIIVVGAGGSIDTDKVTSPVIGFILDPKGLMYNFENHPHQPIAPALTTDLVGGRRRSAIPPRPECHRRIATPICCGA